MQHSRDLKNTTSGYPVLESTWLPRSLAKNDGLIVPGASKKRRALWGFDYMPGWESIPTSPKDEPWWFFKKGQLLTVIGRPKKQAIDKTTWIPVRFSCDGEGWISAQHAYACERKRILGLKEILIHNASLSKSVRALELKDLKHGIILEFDGVPAEVRSWDTSKLSTPQDIARVSIVCNGSYKEVWLSQLNIP